MGYLFTYGDTKKDVIASLSDPSSPKYEVPSCEVIARAVRGNDLWVVYEKKDTKERVLTLFLLRSSDGDWGYKAMDEFAGPYSTSCPLGFLDLVPEPTGGWAGDFRARLRAHYAKSKAVKVGDILTLAGATPPTIKVTKIGRTIYGTDSNGKLYRVPKRVLANATITSEEAA